MPWIECRFSVDTGRQTLSGYSHGGQIALYVFFNHPQTFTNYIIGSPSIAEKERIEMLNARPELKTRNMVMHLISNNQRCDFCFFPERRHGDVIEDYEKIANLVAAQKPQADGL